MKYFPYLSVVSLCAALMAVFLGYMGKPDAATCQSINSTYASLGEPQTCSSSMGAGYWAAFLVLLVLAVVLFIIGASRKVPRA